MKCTTLSAALTLWTCGALAGQPLGLPPASFPSDNPQTEEKITLGKALFKEKRFSADGTISCAHCHRPEKTFTDGLPVAEGIAKQKGTRNTPTVVNAAYFTHQFWDGRRSSLEEQAQDPFVNPIEHGLKSHQPILDVVREDPRYQEQFRKAFTVAPGKIALEHVVKAIAAFERTVVAGDSPFDRYLAGGKKNALSESALRGLELFRGKARCVSCHTIDQSTAIFTDNRFHNLGVGFARIEPKLTEIVDQFRTAKEKGMAVDEAVLTHGDSSELGRFAVTLDISDLGRFKTPTLRNVAVTAPYMHDGSLPTLEAVIDLYNRGGNANPMLDSGIRPLGLTPEERADLVAFMNALSSPQFANLPNATKE